MTIESGIESAGAYIDTLDDTYPDGTDDLAEGDNHIRGIKNCLLNTFPSVTGAITSTHSELNILDGATATASEINYLDLTTGPGTAEASKALVYDSNHHISHTLTGIEWQEIFVGASSTSYLWANDGGDVGLYDSTGAEHILIFDESADTLTTQKALIASAGMTGDVTGNVTGNVTGDLTGAVTGTTVSASGGFTGDLTGNADTATTATAWNGLKVYSNSYSTGSISPGATHTQTVTEATAGITTVYGLIASVRVTAGTGTYDEIQVSSLDDSGNVSVACGNYAWPSGSGASSGNINIRTRNGDAGNNTVTVNYMLIGT